MEKQTHKKYCRFFKIYLQPAIIFLSDHIAQKEMNEVETCI